MTWKTANSLQNPTETASALVAVVGKPNVGKSTLLNRIVGTHLAAVSPKPQTTIRQIRGIYTDERGQLIFTDTPGFHTSQRLFNQALVAAMKQAGKEADILLFVWDLTAIEPEDQELLRLFPLSSHLEEGKDPLAAQGKRVVALNKSDLVPREEVDSWKEKLEKQGIPAVGISALTGEGVEELLKLLFDLAPKGHPLYPEDLLSDLTLRELAVEPIREALFLHLHEELPYECFVEIEEFQEEKEPLYIRAVIHVNKESQKGMLIGAGGKKIRAIGTHARKLLEEFLGKRVYLDLWVKVTPHWRQNPFYVHKVTHTKPHDLK